MRPTPDLLRRQFREPALHEVQPRAIGGCEVHVKPGTLGEPRPDERCFVRSVIVHDEVDVPIGWYAGVDAVQELAERTKHRSSGRSEEHTSELQSRLQLVCPLML